jgi:hypothetical protein
LQQSSRLTNTARHVRTGLRIPHPPAVHEAQARQQQVAQGAALAQLRIQRCGVLQDAHQAALGVQQRDAAAVHVPEAGRHRHPQRLEVPRLQACTHTVTHSITHTYTKRGVSDTNAQGMHDQPMMQGPTAPQASIGTQGAPASSPALRAAAAAHLLHKQAQVRGKVHGHRVPGRGRRQHRGRKSGQGPGHAVLPLQQAPARAHKCRAQRRDAMEPQLTAVDPAVCRTAPMSSAKGPGAV